MSDVFRLSWHTEDDKQAQTILSYQVTEFFQLIKPTSIAERPLCPWVLDWRGHKAQIPREEEKTSVGESVLPAGALFAYRMPKMSKSSPPQTVRLGVWSSWW